MTSPNPPRVDGVTMIILHPVDHPCFARAPYAGCGHFPLHCISIARSVAWLFLSIRQLRSAMRRLRPLLVLSIFITALVTGPATAQITVDIPNRPNEAPGTSITVPVLLNEAVTESDEVSFFEFTIVYESSFLSVTDAAVDGTIAEGANLFDVDTSSPDTISVTASYDDPSAISGAPGDVLVNLTVEINTDASGSTALVFSDFVFNEGDPASIATSGLISTGSLPPNSNLVINEIHADPANDLSGDANNDGTTDSGDDEFVEIINAGTSSIDISGYTLSDNTGVRFTFPAGTSLSPNTAAVVFGGGTPNGIPGLVFTGFRGLNNGGDVVALGDDQGSVVAAVRYGSGAIVDESAVRNPDIDGAFDAHSEASPTSELFSPGRTLDGGELPVELTSFTAVRDGQDAVLRWATASETNNSGFAVQQRRNGTFHEIAFVDGAGTTDRAQQYAHRVSALDAGTHTFRLAQVDLDGTTAPSPSVEVTIPLAQSFALTAAYPNPFRSTARLALEVKETQEVSVTLYNMLGQRIRSVFDGTVQAGTPQTLSIDGSDLSSGVYVYRVQGRTFSATRQVALVK